MTKRAQSAEQTRHDIVLAAFGLSTQKLSLEIVLAEVAERAGVSVQTILRQFGSRRGLFDAVAEFGLREIVAEREAPIGDIRAAIEILCAHYETRGDAVMRWLGQEGQDARADEILTIGRRVHREWIETVFAHELHAYPETMRQSLVELLIVATDVYTWKLFRRDMKLDRETTRERMRQLTKAVLDSFGAGHSRVESH